MAREYRHIKQYEKEIIEMREEGLTYREIGNKYNLTKYQIADFFKRKKKKEREIAAGIQPKKRGRPPKGYVVSEKDKVKELKYKLSQKEARIKSLEMENKLMRDFLSCIERK